MSRKRPAADDGADGSDVEIAEEREDAEVQPSRIVLSLWVTGIVIAIIAGNLGDVGLQAALKAATQPIRTITGLNQNWNVFSPNPRNYSFYIDGEVDFADGTSTTYASPRSALGAYADYRWHKFQETMRPDVGGERLWPDYAAYLADRARAEGREPVRVTLIYRHSATLPPGPGPQREPWTEETLFVLDPA